MGKKICWFLINAAFPSLIALASTERIFLNDFLNSVVLALFKLLKYEQTYKNLYIFGAYNEFGGKCIPMKQSPQSIP